MATSVDLIKDLAIVQGKTYEKVDLLFPGDKSLWTPRAQIRGKWYYKEAVGTEAIEEFYFLDLIYDPITDKTLVRPRLSAIAASSIPPTKYQGEGSPASGNAWVWDLELRDPMTDVVIGLDWGFVQVKPEVTVPI